MLWRPSQLPLAVGDPVTSLADEGSYGWTLTPEINAPVVDEVEGIRCIRYSDGGLNRSLVCAVQSAQSLPVATGLAIFRPTSHAVNVAYLCDTNRANRLGIAMWVGNNAVFGFRSTIRLGPSPVPAIDAWHYAIVYANGANSVVSVDGVDGATGSIGVHTIVDRYRIGAADSSTVYRWPGQIADIGWWPGDKRAEVDAYARAVLGLP